MRRGWRSASLLTALAGAVLAAGLAGPASAARLGVPPLGGGDPAGWFALVSKDAVSAARSRALGDVRGALTLWIEVESRGLRVDLYDPGVFNPALGIGQLDVSLDVSPPLESSNIRYVLQAPDGAVLANVTFGVDTAATDRAVVNLFNSAAAATGVYKLEVTLLDGVPVEEDIAVFGVSVPGHQMFTLNFTGGHARDGGASVTEPVSVFPWLVAGSAGTDAVGPVCGAAFVTYDLDAAIGGGGDPVPPPTLTVTTRQGYVFPAGEFLPSGDARWHQTNNGGLPAGLLDSNDHGTWRWDFADLSVPEDVFGTVNPPLDVNVFSVQILDYAAPPRDTLNWPSLPPFGDSNPRRLYLPQDDGSAPERAWLGHSATVVGGFPAISVGEMSRVQVTLELANPHSYDLTAVVGETHVVADPVVSDPVLINATGLAAVITGRRIDFTGTVAARTTATVVYEVDVTPTALGRAFLTGDGVDFVSPGAPTRATLQTPYTPSLGFLQEVLGPACQIEYEAVMPACLIDAVLTPERLRSCPGAPVGLDPSLSQVFNCATINGVPLYQWRVNGAVLVPYRTDGSPLVVTPYLNDTYTLEMRCSTALPGECEDADSVTFDLYPAIDVDAGADRVSCLGSSTDLAALVSNGTPPYVNGRWTTNPAGQPGDGATTATLAGISPTQTTTYTYRIDDSLGCSGSADVTITVPMPVPDIQPTMPAFCPGGSVELVAAPGFAGYLWSTTDPLVNGSTSDRVTVRESGTVYSVTVTDGDGCQGQQSVMTATLPDGVPGAVGPTLRLDKEGDDVRHSWVDLPTAAGSYEGLAFSCPTTQGPVCAQDPDDAALLAQAPVFSVAPGASSFTEAGAVSALLGGADWLVFVKVRATSACSFTPGPLSP